MRKLMLLCAVLALALPSFGQFSLMPVPKVQFADANGIPLAGGKVCSFAAGTSSPLATYTDSTGETSNSNPVILDSAGRANIWLGASFYKIMLYSAGTDATCATGTLQWSVDNVSGSARLQAPYLVNPTISGVMAPPTPGAADLGSNALPFGSLYLGTASTANIQITGTAAAKRKHTVPDFADDTFTLLAAAQTLSNKTITGYTKTPTITLKTGSGVGDYSSASTSYADVDGTNLSYTVTIPTGYKLIARASGSAFVSTSAVGVYVALVDGATIKSRSILPQGAGNVLPFSIDWVIAGDAASHTVKLQYKTTNGSDAVNIANSDAEVYPVMTFWLIQAN